MRAILRIASQKENTYIGQSKIIQTTQKGITQHMTITLFFQNNKQEQAIMDPSQYNKSRHIYSQNSTQTINLMS